MKRTLINVKLRTSRLTRELSQLLLIIVGIAIGFALFATLQVVLCRRDHPHLTTAECLIPKSNPRHK